MSKSILKVLLLGALSVGASSLPNILVGLSGLPGGQAPGLSASGEAGDIPAVRGGELAALQRAVGDLKALGEARPVNVEGLSAAEREIMQEAAPSLKFRSNTLTRSVGLAPGGGAFPGKPGKIMSRLMAGPTARFQNFSDFRADLLDLYGQHQARMAYALWMIPGMAVILSFVLFLWKRYTLSMMLTGIIFALSSFLIWALSAAVGLSTVLTKQSLLAALPRELWLSPVVFLVVSAGLLRLADENYPFWNRTVKTLFAPIAVSCISAGWLGGGGFLKGIMSSAAALKS